MRKIKQDLHSNDVLKLPIAGLWKINNLANGKTFVIASSASGVTHIKLAKTGQGQARSKEAGQEVALVG